MKKYSDMICGMIGIAIAVILFILSFQINRKEGDLIGAGFLPMIGFSLYLHTGAPFNSAGRSCHGTFGTFGLIILYLLITSTSFCRRRGPFFYADRIYSFAFKNARFFSMRLHRCATHSTDLPGSDGVWNT